MSAKTASGSVGAPRATILVLPGLHGSGPGHWQSIWERRRPELRRVEQACWSRPRLGDWAAALERAVSAAPSPVILVAHSLGCALVAHWARAGRAGRAGRVVGALLVAPADVDRAGLVEARSFAPMPLERLPFSSWVVASANDPFVAIDRAFVFASAWGARFLEAGRAGHINVESGHGSWPEGEALLEALEHAANEPFIRRASQASPRPRLVPPAPRNMQRQRDEEDAPAIAVGSRAKGDWP